MTLLNSHKDILCSGEQFNPYAVVDVDSKNACEATLLERDRTPLSHFERFFSDARGRDLAALGFKFMIGHNTRILNMIANYPNVVLIYLYRRNKLAQISSLIKALDTKRWAQTQRTAHVGAKIRVGPRQIQQKWHEFETYDVLFGPWFDALPNPKCRLEYREMFRPEFERRICDVLNVPFDANMKSPLVKQGSNMVLERFENPAAIEKYFTHIGFGHWLGAEL